MMVNSSRNNKEDRINPGFNNEIHGNHGKNSRNNLLYYMYNIIIYQCTKRCTNRDPELSRRDIINYPNDSNIQLVIIFLF